MTDAPERAREWQQAIASIRRRVEFVEACGLRKRNHRCGLCDDSLRRIHELLDQLGAAVAPVEGPS